MVNASMLKTTQVTERLGVQFRVEAFNLLNRVNYDQPDNFVGSPSFRRDFVGGCAATGAVGV